MILEEMTLQELYKLKRELLSHCVGMTYNMQEVFKINKIIGEKELKLEKGEQNDDRK